MRQVIWIDTKNAWHGYGVGNGQYKIQWVGIFSLWICSMSCIDKEKRATCLESMRAGSNQFASTFWMERAAA